MNKLNYQETIKQLGTGNLYWLDLERSRFISILGYTIDKYFNNYCCILFVPSGNCSENFEEVVSKNSKPVSIKDLVEGKTYHFLAGDKKSFFAKLQGIIETNEKPFLFLKLKSGAAMFWLVQEGGRCLNLKIMD